MVSQISESPRYSVSRSMAFNKCFAMRKSFEADQIKMTPATGLGGWAPRRGQFGRQSRQSGQRRCEPITSGVAALVSFAPLKNKPADAYAAGVPVLSKLEMAVTSCAGANGFASMILLGTPLDAQSSL
jgi:hypothetical protein